MWFAAREGFQVAGIDASPTAIAYAQKRFADEGLSSDFRVGDLTSLPFADESFDLVVDRGAIVCCGLSAGRRAVGEVRRVLRHGGRFFFNPFSARHSSFVASEAGPDGLRVNIHGGDLQGVRQICLYTRAEVDAAIAEGWRVHNFEHLESVDEADPKRPVHAESRVIYEKVKVSKGRPMLRRWKTSVTSVF